MKEFPISEMTQETIQQLRQEYPPGTRIVLEAMDDSHAPPPGTKGTVVFVDDMGQIGMKWDNGSSLCIMPLLDSFSKESQLQKKRSHGMER